jgi:hypothetical protein
VRDAFAHGFDHAGGLHADGGGQVQRVQARAVVHVDEVQADGVVADADFAGPGLAHGHVNHLKFFGPPGWRIWTARLMKTVSCNGCDKGAVILP